MSDKLRIDKYLWSIRLFKTRALASEACEKGRIKYKGASVKASKEVKLHDEYEIKTESGKMIVRVEALLHTRVAYPEAIKAYTDISPEDDAPKSDFQSPAFHTGKRLSKQGRPTKKQMRELGDFFTD